MATFVPVLDSEIASGAGVTDTMPARLADNIEATITQHSTAPRAKIKLGADLVYIGDSVDDIVASATSREGGFYECRNFTVNAGVTLTSTGGVIVIRANSSIVVNGILDSRLDLSDPPPPNQLVNMDGGIGGVGGNIDRNSTYPPELMWGLASNAYSGSGPAVDGEDRDLSSPNAGVGLVSSLSHFLLGTPGHGASGVGPVSSLLRDGGKGGGTIVLISPAVTVNAGGVLNSTGQNGFSSSNLDSRGSGGGGSIIIVTGTFVNNGTIAVDGGSGTGTFPGVVTGDGGQGSFLLYTVIF